MTNKEIMQLASFLNQLMASIKNDKLVKFKFIYGLKRNIDMIRQFAIKISEKLMPRLHADREKSMEYSKKLSELSTIYRQKNAEGKLEIIPEKQQEYDEKITALNEEYKEQFEEAEDRRKSAEYEAKRIYICVDNSLKDEKGEAIIENDAYAIAVDKQQAFNDQMKVLNEEYKDQVGKKEKQVQDQSKYLAEECPDFTPYKIKLDMIPDSGHISAEMLDVLNLIIEE